jgi:Cysteine dioxygenase type I
MSVSASPSSPLPSPPLPSSPLPSGAALPGAPPSATTTAPAAPTQAQLLDFVRRSAADTGLVTSLPLDPEQRTWLRLDGPGGSEVWLIGWPPGTGTGWHDHADSIGAFLTVSGELVENSLAARLPTEGWRILELARDVDRVRRLTSGQGRAFGRHHVHEVFNDSPTRHAVSVHAYHPPLPGIRRYSRNGPVLRLEQTEHPEDWR